MCITNVISCYVTNYHKLSVLIKHSNYLTIFIVQESCHGLSGFSEGFAQGRSSCVKIWMGTDFPSPHSTCWQSSLPCCSRAEAWAACCLPPKGQLQLQVVAFDSLRLLTFLMVQFFAIWTPHHGHWLHQTSNESL